MGRVDPPRRLQPGTGNGEACHKLAERAITSLRSLSGEYCSWIILLRYRVIYIENDRKSGGCGCDNDDDDDYYYDNDDDCGSENYVCY